MSIFIFKTNVSSEQELNKVTTILNNNPKIIKWNIDTEDIDKVLRIEATTTKQDEVITLSLTETGFKCEELPD